jgi:hypothetical protein
MATIEDVIAFQKLVAATNQTHCEFIRALAEVDPNIAAACGVIERADSRPYEGILRFDRHVYEQNEVNPEVIEAIMLVRDALCAVYAEMQSEDIK